MIICIGGLLFTESLYRTSEETFFVVWLGGCEVGGAPHGCGALPREIRYSYQNQGEEEAELFTEASEAAQ